MAILIFFRGDFSYLYFVHNTHTHFCCCSVFPVCPVAPSAILCPLNRWDNLKRSVLSGEQHDNGLLKMTCKMILEIVFVGCSFFSVLHFFVVVVASVVMSFNIKVNLVIAIGGSYYALKGG